MPVELMMEMESPGKVKDRGRKLYEGRKVAREKKGQYTLFCVLINSVN